MVECGLANSDNAIELGFLDYACCSGCRRGRSRLLCQLLPTPPSPPQQPRNDHQDDQGEKTAAYSAPSATVEGPGAILAVAGVVDVVVVAVVDNDASPDNVAVVPLIPALLAAKRRGPERAGTCQLCVTLYANISNCVFGSLFICVVYVY